MSSEIASSASDISDPGDAPPAAAAAKDADEGRSGGRRRRGRKASAAPSGPEQRPWAQLRNPFAPLEAISDDELESIHQAALSVLRDMGVIVLYPEACDLLREAGAEIGAEEQSGRRVRFPPELIEQAIAQAPSSFTLHARNPERDIVFDDGRMAVSMISSPPNCSDLEGGRRPGNHKDFRELVKLGQSLNAVHLFSGYPVEPIDLHASIRHLDCLHDIATLSDKVFGLYALGPERVHDGIEMARIARGIDAETLAREPSVLTIINTNSPLKLDLPMSQGIIEMARAGQVSVITPFTLAGAMAPVTVAGALVEQHAEAMAGLALGQVAKPGAPMMYGSFTSNVDMRSGAPAFGTPEYMKATLVGGQLARRLDLPFRSSNVNAANSVDAQAAYESLFSLWAALSGGTHLLKHGCGWLEGGLVASFEKVVLDAELIQMFQAFFDPLAVDEASLGLDAIREVGPGGHFFGAAHTQERYKTAFHNPMLSDWRNFESWQEAGSPDTARHAADTCKALLNSFEAPPLDPAIRDELDAFVARRKEEGGAPTDF